MSTTILGRWLLALILTVVCLTPVQAQECVTPPASQAAAAPTLAVSGQAPLIAGILQDVVGNRTRLIQASFICIIIGIAILWKK